jgi:alpha-beta hydrolase superfamily lysophospholipase
MTTHAPLSPPLPALAGQRHAFIEWLMRRMFAPVFGWRDPNPNPAERVSIPGLDASVLEAAVMVCEATQPRAVVLLCHPFLRYGKSYFLVNGYAGWLRDAGCHVVAFDFKGFGGSTLAGVCFADDVKAAADWARARFPGLPVHLLGTSFGGFHAVHAIARHGAMVDAAIFDSVPMSIAVFFDRGVVGALMRRISRSRWARPTGTHSLFESLPSMRGIPSLYMFGDRDAYVTRDEIDRVSAACPEARIHHFKDCAHLELRKRQPDAYVKTILEFIDAHCPERVVCQTLEASP